MNYIFFETISYFFQGTLSRKLLYIIHSTIGHVVVFIVNYNFCAYKNMGDYVSTGMQNAQVYNNVFCDHEFFLQTINDSNFNNTL